MIYWDAKVWDLNFCFLVWGLKWFLKLKYNMNLSKHTKAKKKNWHNHIYLPVICLKKKSLQLKSPVYLSIHFPFPPEGNQCPESGVLVPCTTFISLLYMCISLSIVVYVVKFHKTIIGTSLVVQWWRLYAANAGSMSSIPDWGIRLYMLLSQKF